MKKFMSEIKTKAAQAAIAVSGVAANLTVKASDTFTPYSGMNATSIVDGVFKVIAYVGTFGGALYAGGAALAYAMAMRSEDPEAKTKASHHFLGAIALFSVGGIIALLKVNG